MMKDLPIGHFQLTDSFELWWIYFDDIETTKNIQNSINNGKKEKKKKEYVKMIIENDKRSMLNVKEMNESRTP